MNRLCCWIIGIGIIVFAHPSLWATEKDSIDEIVSGFEAEPSEQVQPDLDDIIEGFDDTAQPTEKVTETAEPPFTLNGHLKLGAAYNFAHPAPEKDQADWRGLSRLKTEAGLDLKAKWQNNWRLRVEGKVNYDWAYTLKGRDSFSDDVLDQYEQETELGEAYIQGRLHRRLDLKTGRQIVVWGRSDNIRITDVLNPLDFREPGLVDIEDLRLPVALTRMDAYWGAWNLSAIAGHEIRFNKNPVLGHDFFPGATPLPPEEKPSSGANHTEWALALNGIFSSKDISFYWADIFDEAAYVTMTSSAALVRKHARVNLWGAAGSYALGNWLLIGEGAYWQKLKYSNVADHAFERLDGLVGIEYSGWNDTTVALDWAVRHIIDFEDRLALAPDFAQQDAFETALRISKDFLNATLELNLLAMIFGPLGQDGALERISCKYDWSDAISSTVGVVFYQSGDKYALSNIEDNDRIFLDVKYSF